MDRSKFVAEVVSVGPLDGVDVHVGWASDSRGEGPHLILMRVLDEPDYCIVSGDAEMYATHYGGVVQVALDDDSTTVRLAQDAADALGLPKRVSITHPVGTVDAAWVQGHLDQVLAP